VSDPPPRWPDRTFLRVPLIWWLVIALWVGGMLLIGFKNGWGF
jgi:hypothetical protein